jgi:hypothetical protein
VILAGQSAAMSGYAIWGHDVGGYQDTNFSQSPPNLFMRWAQFGCFSPIMQMHRQVRKELQYPWRYGDQALQNYQFFTRLHTQLFPYIYSYAKEASTTGVPIIRPLVLLNQTDANTFDNRFTYHFGSEFLVAPIIAPNSNTRQVYLPAGNWFDFWTNMKHAGGQTITWTSNQQFQLPLFVREGAIVPMLLTDAQTLCDANYVNNPNIKSPDSGLLFRMYPGGTSEFSVYDGTEIQCAVNGPATVVTLTSAARPVVLQMLGDSPAAISRDGAPLLQRATQAAFDAVDSGWHFDSSTGFTSIKLQHTGGSTKITVETKTSLELGRLQMPVSVLTQHNDNVRSGANLLETKLKTTNVDVNNFGLVASRDVEGLTYAQPLYVPNVMIGGASKNVVYVATMENWVYAFDADDQTPGGTFLWKKQVHPHPVPAHFYGADYNDITGNIGILSTPVVDPASNTIYVVAAAYEPNVLNGPAAQAQQAFKQLLFALDLSTGNLRPAAVGAGNPIEIGGSATGVGYFDAQKSKKPVDKTGGDAKLTVTITARDAQGNPTPKNFIVTDAIAGQVIFSPMQQLQRPALLMANGVLYIAFGSHGDIDPYHGWVFAYDAATLRQRGVFCATPNGAEGGIWQAGEGLVADGAGNVYCGSGNGDSKINVANGPNLGETFIRLRAGAASLDLNAFLTVFQDATNPVFDEDLGAASPTILPDGFLVGGGKDGNFYLVDPSKMTSAGFPGALAQQFLATRGPGSRARVFFNGQEVSTHHIHGSPTVYNSPNHGPLVYVWGENNVLRAYRYDSAAHNFPGQPNQRNVEGAATARGTLFASNDSPQRRGMPGAMLSISANAQTPGTAILWASFPPFDDANQQIVDGALVAYDGTQFDAQGRLVLLWHSHQNPGQDDVGKFAKFCCPTIANGKVFLATFSNKLRIYGPRAIPDGGYNFAFGGKTGLTLNGSARSNGGPVRLVGMHVFQAGSVFFTQPVNITRFTTTFRFQLLGQNSADGITFCVQSEGPRALGGPGGGLGYGPDPLDPLDPGFKITRSVALKFGLFDSQANQPRSLMGLYRNGDSPIAAHAIGGEFSLDTNGINFHSGHQFRATLTYDGTTLQCVIRDLTLQTEITRAFPIDIPAITGNSAFVGFTGATGGLTANEDILSWQFTS